jgi:hypothetical protein
MEVEFQKCISDDEQPKSNSRRTGEGSIKRIVYTQKKSNNSDHLLGLFFHGFKFYGIFFFALVFYGMSFLCLNFYGRIFYVMAHSKSYMLSMEWSQKLIIRNYKRSCSRFKSWAVKY